MSRNLDFLLRGNFGNVVFVFDEGELTRRFKKSPVAYGGNIGWEDEFEERIFAKEIPASMIRGVIFLYPMRRFEVEEWSDLGYPVVFRGQNGWTSSITMLPSARKVAMTYRQILINRI